MPRAALPLSYMAGSILLYEEMTSVTMLQLALEPFLSANSAAIFKTAQLVGICGGLVKLDLAAFEMAQLKGFCCRFLYRCI